MSTTTEKFGFIKPEKTDPADITATNANWDKLDEALVQRDQDMSMGGYKITDVAEPELRSDVATRGFVEDFSIEGSTYVAVDENNDGNVVLRPYVPLVDDPADYIIEQDTVNDGNCTWVYEKRKNGIIILYGFEKRSITVNKTSNGAISRTTDNPFPLPTNLGVTSIFNFVPQANGEDVGVWGGQGYWGGYTDETHPSGSLAVYADVFYPTDWVKDVDSIEINFNLMVVGRWI